MAKAVGKRSAWSKFESAKQRTGSRADFAFEALRIAIWEGRFAKGEHISEEDIAHRLGISRTPVREALQRLQQRGLLVPGAGRRLLVAELSVQQILELYAMREILEGSAAGFAAQQATATEIEYLHHLQQALAQAQTDDPQTLIHLNRRFHQAIYDAAHNEYLNKTLETLHDSLALLNNTTFRIPNRRSESDEEHRLIVQAIANRAPEDAERAARVHIRKAKSTRFEAMAKAPARP